MKNKIGDLRDHLFETLEALKDDEHPMDIDRAKAIADVARVIVDTAKAEIAFAVAVSDLPQNLALRGSSFLEVETAPVSPPRPQLRAAG